MPTTNPLPLAAESLRRKLGPRQFVAVWPRPFWDGPRLLVAVSGKNVLYRSIPPHWREVPVSRTFVHKEEVRDWDREDQ